MNIYELAEKAAALDGDEPPAERVVDLVIMATARVLLEDYAPTGHLDDCVREAVYDVRDADFDDDGEPV